MGRAVLVGDIRLQLTRRVDYTVALVAHLAGCFKVGECQGRGGLSGAWQGFGGDLAGNKRC